MTGHSPGPWGTERYQGELWITAPDDQAPNDPWQIARMELCAGRGEDPIEANARLIAAAPDLLTAVRAAVELSDQNLADDGGFRTAMCQAVYDACVAAIAKAEGRE